MRNAMTHLNPITHGINCTRGARALCWGPSAARPLTLHAPAASLASHSRRCGGGRPATVSPQAQNGSCGPLFRRSLGLAPCPHPMRCSLRGSRAASLGAPRTASLSSAASASLLGDRPASSRRRSALRPVGRHLAAPSALRASGALCVGIRSAGRARLRYAPALASPRALRPARLCPARCAGAVLAAPLPTFRACGAYSHGPPIGGFWRPPICWYWNGIENLQM